MPMFNVEAYIGDAIRSLKEQTFGDFEVVLVDDGSTDDTLKVARDAVDLDGRFKIVSQQNAGPATARNHGVSASSGTYLMFLDADDTLAENALLILYNTAISRKLDYLDFSARTVYEREQLRAVRDESFYEGRASIDGVMTGRELFARFQRNGDYVCALWLHFFRRTLMEENGLWLRDGMYVHEDELFSPLLIAQAKRASFLNEALYVRRVRDGSAMTSGRGIQNVSSLFEAAQGLKSWLIAHDDGDDLDFCSAMAQRIAELYRLAAEDAAKVPASELVAYSAKLSAAERVDFEVSVVQGMIEREEFLGSRTYRAGKAVLALPKAAIEAARRLSRSG